MSAHWRKAPFALRHPRTVLLGVFVAAPLVALASSSALFVTTAAASEALKNKLVDLTLCDRVPAPSDSYIDPRLTPGRPLRQAEEREAAAARSPAGSTFGSRC